MSQYSSSYNNIRAAVAFEAAHNSNYNGGYWRCLTKSANTSTYTETTVPIEIDKVHNFRIVAKQNTCMFFIDNIQVATHTINIPTEELTLTYAGTRETFTNSWNIEAITDWCDFEMIFNNNRKTY